MKYRIYAGPSWDYNTLEMVVDCATHRIIYRNDEDYKPEVYGPLYYIPNKEVSWFPDNILPFQYDF